MGGELQTLQKIILTERFHVQSGANKHIGVGKWVFECGGGKKEALLLRMGDIFTYSSYNLTQSKIHL